MAEGSPAMDVETLLAELVQIETENPPGNEARGAEYIVDWFTKRDIDAKLISEPFPDRPQVIARVGTGEPTVVLNGHIDVVPAGDQSRWSHDPYGGIIEDGALYGRGSVDMKTGIALGMLALASLKRPIEAGTCDGSVLQQVTVGGESAETGTGLLLDQGYDGRFAVILEPTGLRTAVSEKGAAWYKFVVTGDASHASRPDQGTNALDDARVVLDALETYDERVRQRTDDLVGQAYATVTQLSAGTKENVIPETATITLDRRYLPSEDLEEVDAEIDDLLAEVARVHDISVTWERTDVYRSAYTDPEGDLAEVFRRLSHDAADVPAEPLGLVVSTDLSEFVARGMDAIVWGPGDMSQAHTVDEHMDLAGAQRGLEILLTALQELLQ